MTTMRQIQVRATERLFADQVVENYRGSLDEAPNLVAIRGPILAAVSRGETGGTLIRDGRFPADKGAHRYSWWVADDGRDD